MADYRDHSTSVRAGEELDPARLEEFLRSHFLEPTGTVSVKQFPTDGRGRNHLSVLLHLENAQNSSRA
jgi:hypothetical protein